MKKYKTQHALVKEGEGFDAVYTIELDSNKYTILHSGMKWVCRDGKNKIITSSRYRADVFSRLSAKHKCFITHSSRT